MKITFTNWRGDAVDVTAGTALEISLYRAAEEEDGLRKIAEFLGELTSALREKGLVPDELIIKHLSGSFKVERGESS